MQKPKHLWVYVVVIVFWTVMAFSESARDGLLSQLEQLERNADVIEAQAREFIQRDTQ